MSTGIHGIPYLLSPESLSDEHDECASDLGIYLE